MSALGWTPWHKVVRLRDDVRTGELSLATFAADLYDVVMDRGRLVYQNPLEFFTLTYPTYNLRELVKDVVLRLAGKSDKAVRQLQQTYGGGKTHALITLYHLLSDPPSLPSVDTVETLRRHVGIELPRTRIAVLPFDKLDVDKGMEVRAPDGSTHWLKQPWSVLAFQLAGDKGLQLLHAGGLAEERASAPAENLLTELLGFPGRQGLSTLLLIDEVTVYAKEKIAADPAWRDRLLNFFQYLTQAATKVDRCAIVVTLLTVDTRTNDERGRELVSALHAIFQREREPAIQPVQKEDLAEVLRRRFFTADSIRSKDAFRAPVVAALRGIAELDEQTARDGKVAEDRFVDGYPFHPDLTDIFYSKWTQLDSFQRTRGILRTFAVALRDAEGWDLSPLVGANVFLNRAGTAGLSEAAGELATIAAVEEVEGKYQEWSSIIEGELRKAVEIQKQFSALRGREIEEAVFATFLHSQPIGQQASTRDLRLLLGQTRPDRIELEQALRRWTDLSWFLDEAGVADAELAPDGSRLLPKAWRLGNRPNLRQMHAEARERVSVDLAEARLVDEIKKVKSLTAGASAAGATVHLLPVRPSDVDDDGEFHYVVLGPKAASLPGRPSLEAKRYLLETTDSTRPRARKNPVVLAVPSIEGLAVAVDRIRDSIAWDEVWNSLKDAKVDPIRALTLRTSMDDARKSVPEAVAQAYTLAIALSVKGEVEAYRITAGDKPLFTAIKEDPQVRIQDTPVSPDSLLPDGPYYLWGPNDRQRWVKDIVDSFAQNTQLPKMLKRKAILDTIAQGCLEGLYVLRLERPDHSVRTFWRTRPDEVALREPNLQMVLPETAELVELAPDLLDPGRLPDLWPTDAIQVSEVIAYFSGDRVVQVDRAGYPGALAVPRASRSIVEDAVRTAIRSGKLWLSSESISLLSEDVPAGVLVDDSSLRRPPPELAVRDLLPENLPEAWQSSQTSALRLFDVLATRRDPRLPWITLQKAIQSALTIHYLERAPESGPWPCDLANAASVLLLVPTIETAQSTLTPSPASHIREVPPGVLVAEAELGTGEIQDLAEQISEIKKAAVGLPLKFQLRIELGGPTKPTGEAVEQINEILHGISSDLCLK